MLLVVATKTTAIEDIPVLTLKSLSVKYVKRGTNTTPPPIPNIPERNPPTDPMKNKDNNLLFKFWKQFFTK